VFANIDKFWYLIPFSMWYFLSSMLLGGKEFCHVVLKEWLRSNNPEDTQKLFVLISCIQRNLVPFGDGDIIVNAESFYNEFVQFLKLGRKTVSKLIVVQGLYVNGN